MRSPRGRPAAEPLGPEARPPWSGDFSYPDSNNPGLLVRPRPPHQEPEERGALERSCPVPAEPTPTGHQAAMRDAAADIAVPPVAARRPTVLETHGDRRVDDWHWLRDRDDPAVLAHLRAENDYTEAVTAGQAGLRQTLFDEIRARIAETDLSVAVRKDEWWYFARTF